MPSQFSQPGRPSDAGAEETLAALLSSSAGDPVLMHELQALQAKTCESIEALIDEVAGMLKQELSAASPEALELGQPLNAAALAVGRKRGGTAQECRELAQALVIGSLLNHGNPDWDPARPETSRSDRSGLLYSLIHLGQKAAENHSPAA